MRNEGRLHPPGDTSGSARYYHRDITEPFVLDDGHLTVPTGPARASYRTRTHSRR